MTTAAPPPTETSSRVERALGGPLRTLFLPIVDLETDTVHGQEALMRGPAGLPQESPPMAFAFAKSLGLLADLDRQCVQNALETPHDGRLFVNLHPSTLEHGPTRWLGELARRTGRDPSSVTLEIVEHEISAGTEVSETLVELRGEGFQIAVDDLGEGAAGLRRVVELRPDYAKIDRWFVRGCATDQSRRAVLDAMARLGETLGVRIVAEGIETEDELEVVRELGIPLGQGFVFGRPSGPESARPEADDSVAEAVLTRIDEFAPRELDTLPFGVIQLAPDGVVLQFNQYEANLSNRRAPEVIGRNFFTEVAPCTDVREFAGRFHEGVRQGHLNVGFDYRFDFATGPRAVKVTLYLSSSTETIWVFVQDRGAPDKNNVPAAKRRTL